jgi:hypothetical protein
MATALPWRLPTTPKVKRADAALAPALGSLVASRTMALAPSLPASSRIDSTMPAWLVYVDDPDAVRRAISSY